MANCIINRRLSVKGFTVDYDTVLEEYSTGNDTRTIQYPCFATCTSSYNPGNVYVDDVVVGKTAPMCSTYLWKGQVFHVTNGQYGSQKVVIYKVNPII